MKLDIHMTSDVVYSQSHYYTVWSVIGIIMSSVCTSVRLSLTWVLRRRLIHWLREPRSITLEWIEFGCVRRLPVESDCAHQATSRSLTCNQNRFDSLPVYRICSTIGYHGNSWASYLLVPLLLHAAVHNAQRQMLTFFYEMRFYLFNWYTATHDGIHSFTEVCSFSRSCIFRFP